MFQRATLATKPPKAGPTLLAQYRVIFPLVDVTNINWHSVSLQTRPLDPRWRTAAMTTNHWYCAFKIVQDNTANVCQVGSHGCAPKGEREGRQLATG